MAGSRLAAGAGGVSSGCTYATPREGGSRDNSKLAKSFTAASSRLWMRPSNSSGVENWSLSSPGAATVKPGGREVLAGRGGGGGILRGRGLRWIASSGDGGPRGQGSVGWARRRRWDPPGAGPALDRLERLDEPGLALGLGGGH